MAQRIASQKRMLSSVIVTFRITLTIKRSIRKPAMTETAVTTCGVTIFEISQMAPITTESRIASSMKRVQPKRRTCLGEVGCCLILSIEVVRRFQPKSIVKTCIYSHIAEYPSHSFFIFWMYRRVGYMSIGLTFVKHRHGVIAREGINNSIPTRALKDDIAFCHTDILHLCSVK